MIRHLGVFVLFIAAVSLVACQSREEPALEKDYERALPDGAPALVRVTDPRELPDLRSAFANRRDWEAALLESEAYFKKPSSKSWFPYETSDRTITHEDEVATLSALRRIMQASENAEDFHAWCRIAFDVYKSVGWDGSGEVLFTAYCEPIFEGRRRPEGAFRHPLHRLPEDLVKADDGKCLGRRLANGDVVPYFTRSELMDNHHLDGLEFVYLRDPFEVYVAQVQGSARINLETGEQICVGYAGKTEYDYQSIGRYLVKSGKIRSRDLSLVTLERYFAANPAELDRVLRHNPSYVFFTEREPGPFGSLGGKVTPYHSLATDKDVFPRGGPCVVKARLPRPEARGPEDFQPQTLLVFDQDTGGAIRSAGRADLFIGTGDRPKQLAGFTQEEGRLLYLFVKPGATLP